MNEVRYLPQKEVDALYERVEENLVWYYTGKGESPVRRGVRVRKARVAVPVRSLQGVLEPDSASDAKNARAVFTAIRGLTRHQASDARLWVQLCHDECAGYVRKRWLRPERSKAKRVQAVRNHFFARTSRAVFRDNGVSRLWWLGRVAEDIADLGADPELFLEILLHRQDIRSTILERPSTTMNRRVLHRLYDVMRRHWNNQDRRLFRRDVFRAWMKGLNREGGVLLLDALPDAALENLAADQADIALKTVGG